MTLIPRRRRPIPRSEGMLRDARLFVVATEDTYAPKQYFRFFSHPRIHIVVLETTEERASNPNAVVNRLVYYAQEYQIGQDDQLWALLDTDHWIEPHHKSGLIGAIQDARQRGYRVAMSNPCFDLWLLLHHEDVAPSAVFANCDAVGARIRDVKGEFNKTNLKPAHYPIQQVSVAIRRARSLEANPEVASLDYWPKTTGTRVFLLLEALISAGLVTIQ